MWDDMGRRACRRMLLRLTAGRKAIRMVRVADRRHCARDMGEKVRRECVGMSRLRGRGRAEMIGLVERRERRLRIMEAKVVAAEVVLSHLTAAEVVLNRPVQQLR